LLLASDTGSGAFLAMVAKVLFLLFDTRVGTGAGVEGAGRERFGTWNSRTSSDFSSGKVPSFPLQFNLR
jgi:hypothetical protein